MAKKPAKTIPQWENKVGWATITGILQLILLIAGGGVMWGIVTTKLDVNTTNTLDLKQSFMQVQKDTQKDRQKESEKLSAQNERIGKIETSVGFISQAVSRIEATIAK